MAAAYVDVAVEAVVTDTSKPTEEFLRSNPLGKIPVLVTDSGETIFDSRAIVQHLHRQSGSRLFPRNAAKRADAETLEALADGICYCALAHVYERRFRPRRSCTSHGWTGSGKRWVAPWMR